MVFPGPQLVWPPWWPWPVNPNGPRNLPGFSGDCVCPETLPDWRSDLEEIFLTWLMLGAEKHLPKNKEFAPWIYLPAIKV